MLSALMQLDKEDDVNKVLRYFSYEHFYVIYCKVRGRLGWHWVLPLLRCGAAWCSVPTACT